VLVDAAVSLIEMRCSLALGSARYGKFPNRRRYELGSAAAFPLIVSF
jgi:hypothetical protein